MLFGCSVCCSIQNWMRWSCVVFKNTATSRELSNWCTSRTVSSRQDSWRRNTARRPIRSYSPLLRALIKRLSSLWLIWLSIVWNSIAKNSRKFRTGRGGGRGERIDFRIIYIIVVGDKMVRKLTFLSRTL